MSEDVTQMLDQFREDERLVEEASARLMQITELQGLANPLLDALLEFGGPFGYESFLTAFSEEKFQREMVAWRLRRVIAPWFAWAVPTEEALAAVGTTGEVVEIGAGGGYWAGMLRARGVTVHAYDVAPHENYQVTHGWSPVHRGNTKAAAHHPQATLFLCWPPYDSRMAEIAVERYRRAGGRRVAYIGESGGCTGESPRLNALEPVADIAIPQWPGLHDYLRIYEL